MNKIMGMARILLRKMYVAFGITAMPYLVYAAYGMREPDPGSYTVPVQGRVISEETGEFITGIHVIYDRFISVDTDSEGRFFFYLPEEELYHINFIDTDGFENGGFFLQKQINISRDEAGDLLKISLRMESKITVVRGITLSKETGGPVSGIKVSVFSGGNDSTAGFNDSGFTVFSDSDGRFSIQVPERDSYYIRFSDVSSMYQWKQMEVSSGDIKNPLRVDLEYLNR
ncbi:MAG: carboxypeptidase-like regulatory domain-containing protein [Treponema sp.]|nr:carboxypeptidase-like regulatory domain-containing protein [Treponema sp.]